MVKISTFLVSLLFVFSSLAQDNATLKVLVTSMDNQVKPQERIEFVSKENGKIFKGTTNTEGTFNIDLPGGDTYSIRVIGIGQSRDYNTIAIPELKPNEQYGAYQLTIAFDLPKQFVLNNLHFDTGKSTIRSGSYSDLNDLVELLTLKSELNIRVEGHTDNEGNDDSNLKLSEARALAVKQYLIRKGISADRIVCVGFGENKPIASNETATGRQKNRRTEIHLID